MYLVGRLVEALLQRKRRFGLILTSDAGLGNNLG